MLLLLAACSGSPDDTAAGADTADTAPVDPLCVDAAPLTWETWGEGFLIDACDGCHAASAPNRYGAPIEATFDTKAQAWALADRILARATGEAPTMPPQGGVTEDDRTRLYWWLGCGEPGT